MSKYRRIATQFKDEGSLRQALADARIEFEYGQSLALYGYMGDPRPETAEIIIRRHHVGRGANDIGFHRLADGTFEVIISDFDSKHNGAQIVKEVKRRYARLQVEKLARAHGYRVEEVPAEGGVIRLRLVTPSTTRRPTRAYLRR